MSRCEDCGRRTYPPSVHRCCRATLPVEPLVEFCGGQTRAAHLCGMAVATLKDGHTIDVYAADRAAARLGEHPSMIWGAAWSTADDDVSVA